MARVNIVNILNNINKLYCPWGQCSGVLVFYTVLSLESFLEGGTIFHWQPISLKTCVHPLVTAGCRRAIVSASAASSPELLRMLCSAGALWSRKDSHTRHGCKGIDLHLLGEAKLVRFGMDLIPGGVSQIGGATKNSCSDWDERIRQWQKITRIKAVSLTKWWLKRAKEM